MIDNNGWIFTNHNFEIKNINISIINHDHSTYAQKLTSTITASGYFKLIDYGTNFQTGLQQIESDTADLVLEIPPGFEKYLVRENQQKLLIAVNAINGTKTTLGSAYLSNIISRFNCDIRFALTKQQKSNQSATIEVNPTNWFNPLLTYKIFMVPGILVTLVTMIAMYRCALNIVKEKEIGTIAQINVTPIKKYHFIIGKPLPFWLTGMFVFYIGLFGVGRLVYGIIPQGSILLLYAFLFLAYSLLRY